MKSNQIMFYNTTVNEALEILDMESRRDDYGFVGMNRFKMKLNKNGPHVLITLVSSLDNVSLEDGIIDLKVDFPHKFRDMESIERVQAVFRRDRKSKFWKEILEELQSGEPLNWKVDEILSETEERIKNPDPHIQELVNKAVLVQPHNRFFRSLYDQFIGGRELSEKQIEVLIDGLREAMSFGNQPHNQIRRVEVGLSLAPRSRFLQSLKSQSEDGMILSERQMKVVEKIIKDESDKLLNDLKKNVNLNDEDFRSVQKGQRKGIDSLSEEERKRLRHLVYRNQRRLDRSYSKESIRTMLQKMGSRTIRTASLDMITEVAIISDINEVFDEDLDNDLDVYVEDTGLDSNGNGVMLCEVENGEYYAIVIDPYRHRDQEVKSVFARKSDALRVFKKLTQNKRRFSSLQKQSRREVVLISRPTTTTQLFKTVDETIFKKIFRGLRKIDVSPKKVVIEKLVGFGEYYNKKLTNRFNDYELTLSIPSMNVENVVVRWGGRDTEVIHDRKSYPTERGGATGIVNALGMIIFNELNMMTKYNKSQKRQLGDLDSYVKEQDSLSAYLEKMNKYYGNNPFAWD